MLSRQNRLTSRYDFNKTRFIAKKNNTKYFGKFVDIFYYEPFNYNGPVKVGIIVSNRVSKSAVQRNRAKRIIREVIRKEKDSIEKKVHIVIHAKTLILESNYEEISSEINKILQKLSLTR